MESKKKGPFDETGPFDMVKLNVYPSPQEVPNMFGVDYVSVQRAGGNDDETISSMYKSYLNRNNHMNIKKHKENVEIIRLIAECVALKEVRLNVKNNMAAAAFSVGLDEWPTLTKMKQAIKEHINNAASMSLAQSTGKLNWPMSYVTPSAPQAMVVPVAGGGSASRVTRSASPASRVTRSASRKRQRAATDDADPETNGGARRRAKSKRAKSILAKSKRAKTKRR